MSAGLTEVPTAPRRSQPESNPHRILHDLTVAKVTFELVAECEDLSTDLRRLVETARQRLLSSAEQLMSREAGNQTRTPLLSAAH